MKALTYLACPYSSPEAAIREARFRAVNIAAAALMRAGHLVFSPISHSHPIAEAGALPREWTFWAAFDRAYLEASRELIVLRLDGWRESVGVTAELAIAAELEIPVSYIDPLVTELPQEAPSPGELVAGDDGPRPDEGPARAQEQNRPTGAMRPGGQRVSVEGGPPTSTAAAKRGAA